MLGMADLAASQQCPVGAGLVVVATLSPQPCLLFPHQAAAGSRLSAPGMGSLFSLYVPGYSLLFAEIPGTWCAGWLV